MLTKSQIELRTFIVQAVISYSVRCPETPCLNDRNSPAGYGEPIATDPRWPAPAIASDGAGALSSCPAGHGRSFWRRLRIVGASPHIFLRHVCPRRCRADTFGLVDKGTDARSLSGLGRRQVGERRRGQEGIPPPR